jgi:hypothetical protein
MTLTQDLARADRLRNLQLSATLHIVLSAADEPVDERRIPVGQGMDRLPKPSPGLYLDLPLPLFNRPPDLEGLRSTLHCVGSWLPPDAEGREQVSWQLEPSPQPLTDDIGASGLQAALRSAEGEFTTVLTQISPWEVDADDPGGTRLYGGSFRVTSGSILFRGSAIGLPLTVTTEDLAASADFGEAPSDLPDLVFVDIKGGQRCDARVSPRWNVWALVALDRPVPPPTLDFDGTVEVDLTAFRRDPYEDPNWVLTPVEDPVLRTGQQFGEASIALPDDFEGGHVRARATLRERDLSARRFYPRIERPARFGCGIPDIYYPKPLFPRDCLACRFTRINDFGDAAGVRLRRAFRVVGGAHREDFAGFEDVRVGQLSATGRLAIGGFRGGKALGIVIPAPRAGRGKGRDVDPRHTPFAALATNDRGDIGGFRMRGGRRIAVLQRAGKKAIKYLDVEGDGAVLFLADNGFAVGVATADNRRGIFLVDENGNLARPETLARLDAAPVAVTPSGRIALNYRDDDGRLRGACWDPERGLLELALPTGFEALIVTAMNADGTTVGILSGESRAAFVFSEETGVVELTSRLPSAAEWRPVAALDITDTGAILVEIDTPEGSGYTILDPPARNDLALAEEVEAAVQNDSHVPPAKR